MTHQEFSDLRVGDIVYISLGLFIDCEIIDVGKSFYFSPDVIRITIKERIKGIIYTIKRQNGLWWFNNTCLESTNKEPKFITLIKKKEDMIQDKIKEAKNEIARLEKLVKTLEDEKKSKELKEQISKLIPGDFYTVKTNDSMTFTGIFSKFNNEQILFTHPEVTTKYGFGIEILQKIIHRPDFTNEFNNLMKKLETFNKEIHNDY